MTNASEQVVRDFCAAWTHRDVDELLAFFAEGALYHNIPGDPARGLEEIRALIESFVPASEAIEFIVHNIFGGGNWVATERTDRFVVNGKTIELPVAGMFELRDGKITVWRDYFDRQTFTSQSP